MRVAQAGVIDRLVRRSDLSVTAPVSLAVAGLAGRAVDLSVPTTASAAVRVVNTAQTTYFVFPPGTTGRLFELMFQATPMVILYDAQASTFAAFKVIADQIVASLVFST